jgi:hypothetical protein
MSRSPLALYELDRDALKALSAELRQVLMDNDAAALARLLELSQEVARDLQDEVRLVERFLLPEDDPRSRVLLASLRRISKKRAMTPVFKSQQLSLEGRLRGYEVLRDDVLVAGFVDKLLDQARLPWYLRRQHATGGWLNGSQRQQLVARLQGLRPVLTDELNAFAEGLNEVGSDVVAHDGL